jgi:hypothetical protein
VQARDDGEIRESQSDFCGRARTKNYANTISACASSSSIVTTMAKSTNHKQERGEGEGEKNLSVAVIKSFVCTSKEEFSFLFIVKFSLNFYGSCGRRTIKMCMNESEQNRMG